MDATAARCLGWMIGLAAIASPAGEIEEYREITPAEVKAREFRPGEKLRIIGKYQELINRELRLFDVEARFLIEDPAVSRKIFDSTPEKDNFAVRGAFLETSGVSVDPVSVYPAFRVEEIEIAPGDPMIFEGKLAAILDKKDGRADEVLALARAIAANLNRFGDPLLKPIARRAFSEAFVRAEGALPPEDADGRLGLIRQVHESLKDIEFSLQLLRVQTRRFKDHAPTLAFLSELRCYQFGGDWMTYPQFKTKLGFVLVGDRWVKPARKEFEDLVEKLRAGNQNDQILRTKTDREYQLLAQAGKVERGMTREEVADGIGLPDRVDRTVQQSLEIDQWTIGDRRIYFLNGHVVVVKDKAPGTEEPKPQDGASKAGGARPSKL
jgi:hypothetical protein